MLTQFYSMASNSAIGKIKYKSYFSYEELKSFKEKAYRNGNWRKVRARLAEICRAVSREGSVGTGS